MSGECETCGETPLECRCRINHPTHYKGNKFEVIDVIEDFGLGFNLGNSIKYILRSGKKDNSVEDLKKAIWYIEREIGKVWNS